MEELPEVTLDDVGLHNRPEDLWLAIDGYVYNLSEFLNEHPGGAKPLIKMAGKDATEKFMKVDKHYSSEMVKTYLDKFRIAKITK